MPYRSKFNRFVRKNSELATVNKGGVPTKHLNYLFLLHYYYMS